MRILSSEEDMEIEVVDDRPMEDRVPPRAESGATAPAMTRQMTRRLSIRSVCKSVFKKIKIRLSTKSAAPRKSADREARMRPLDLHKRGVSEKLRNLRNTLAQGEGVLLEARPKAAQRLTSRGPKRNIRMPLKAASQMQLLRHKLI